MCIFYEKKQVKWRVGGQKRYRKNICDNGNPWMLKRGYAAVRLDTYSKPQKKKKVISKLLSMSDSKLGPFDVQVVFFHELMSNIPDNMKSRPIKFISFQQNIWISSELREKEGKKREKCKTVFSETDGVSHEKTFSSALEGRSVGAVNALTSSSQERCHFVLSPEIADIVAWKDFWNVLVLENKGPREWKAFLLTWESSHVYQPITWQNKCQTEAAAPSSAPQL